MRAEKGLFKARDGTSIYYEVQGKGRPLIFCYGLVCRRDHWHHQIQHFAERYLVVTFDYRGHQTSSRPGNDQHLTLDWCARDVEDLMKHLALGEAVCLGHSMGVPVITHLAQLVPQMLKGVVFVCGSVDNPFHHMFHTNRMEQVYRATAALYEIAPSVVAKIWERFTERNVLSYFLTSRLGFNATTAEEQDILMYMDGVNQTPFSTFYSLIKDYTSFDGRRLLKNVVCPTLVVAGEEDVITPMSLQEEMAGLLPKGELQVIARGSHNAHMDFPHLVNEVIDAFLGRIEYR